MIEAPYADWVEEYYRDEPDEPDEIDDEDDLLEMQKDDRRG
jgi:hypothetical protein